MINKYFNDAILGNGNILASFSNKGELLRFFYPSVDYMQHIENFKVGITCNESNTVWLHDDINNLYYQYFEENSNILNTKIFNNYFKINIIQKDYIAIFKNILIKKYTITNQESNPQSINFLIYSKLLRDMNNYTSSYFKDDILIQYNHNYAFGIYSNLKPISYQINGSSLTSNVGKIKGKDYIGMSNDSSVLYSLGTLEPNETKEIIIYISVNEKIDFLIKDLKNINEKEEYEKTYFYWTNYAKKHKTMNIHDKKINEIYTRSILTFPLLTNIQTGGILAGVEIDENMTKCGRYSYCWPRDSIFITKALDLCNMSKEVENFYNKFAKNTQLENGMWEQRYYTDGTLAPCWGYQIDETASIIYGVWAHYEKIKNINFLGENIQMLEKACDYLQYYLNNINDIQKSYDLWEETEGIHTYSLCAIHCSFECMIKIYKELNFNDKEEKINILKLYIEKIKNIIEKEFYNGQYFLRNDIDTRLDISLLGLCIPFNVFDVRDERINKTVKKIEEVLKNSKGGIYRYQNDNYMTGNPWVISTLWFALYHIEAGNLLKAKEYFDWVCQTSCMHGYLAEQIDKFSNKPAWVIGLRLVTCNVCNCLGKTF